MEKRWQEYLDRLASFVKEEVVRQADELDASHTYPAEMVRALAGLGVFGLPIPRRYGGLEAPVSVQIEVSRLVAQGWLSLSSIVGTHWRVASYVLGYGSEEQKAELLPAMASGNRIAANGHTEKNGKDWRFLETELTENGGHFALRGEKAYVTNAADADLIAVTAKCAFPGLTPDGFVIAILPRNHLGLIVGADLPRLGIRGVSICPLTLENCLIDPAKHLLGKGSGARAISDSSLVPKLLDVTARAVGIGERLIEKSRLRLQEERSPRSPLKNLPLAKYRFAAFAGKIRLASLALRQLAVLADRGQGDPTEAHFLQAFATEAALEAAHETLLLHGGAGYTTDAFVQRSLRDVTSLQLVGTPRDQILESYSNQLLAERGK